MKDISIQDHQRLIISRVLNFGDIIALKWLFKTYKVELIKETVVSSNNLRHNKKNFWKLVLKIENE